MALSSSTPLVCKSLSLPSSCLDLGKSHFISVYFSKDKCMHFQNNPKWFSEWQQSNSSWKQIDVPWIREMQGTEGFYRQRVKPRGSSLLGRGRVLGFGENQKHGGKFWETKLPGPTCHAEEELGEAGQVLLGTGDADESWWQRGWLWFLIRWSVDGFHL